MVDFTQLLSKNLDDVERPEPLPEGSYLTSIVGYKTVESAKQQTPGVEIELKIVAPGEDVDPDAYAKIQNPQDKTLKTQFWLTEGSMWRLKDFLEKAGCDLTGKSFAEVLADIAGQQIVSIVSHRVGNDNESVFAEVKRFLKAE